MIKNEMLGHMYSIVKPDILWPVEKRRWSVRSNLLIGIFMIAFGHVAFAAEKPIEPQVTAQKYLSMPLFFNITTHFLAELNLSVAPDATILKSNPRNGLTRVESTDLDLKKIDHLIIIVTDSMPGQNDFLHTAVLNPQTFDALKIVSAEIGKKRKGISIQKGAISPEFVPANGPKIAVAHYAMADATTQSALGASLQYMKNAVPNAYISIIAYRDACSKINAWLTNVSMQSFDFPVDTLLYIQSPIDSYAHKLSFDFKQPKGINRLIHFYTKSEVAQGIISGSVERKYPQQARINAQSDLILELPVYNIRTVWLNPNGNLDNIPTDQFFSGHGLRNIAQLLSKIDAYKLNTDLISKFDVIEKELKQDAIQFIKEKGTEKEVNQLLQSYAKVPLMLLPQLLINRFIDIDSSGNLMYQTSDAGWIFGASQANILSSKKVAEYGILPRLKEAFTKEYKQAQVELAQLQIPSEDPGVLALIYGRLEKELDRIRQDYLKIQTSSKLLERPSISDPFFDYTLKDNFKKINELMPVPMFELFAFEQMEKGKRYMQALLTHNEGSIAHTTQAEYLNSIIAIIWYLYGGALRKGQDFIEGTFVLKDTNRIIFNYFINYIKRFGAPITGDPAQDKGLHVSFDPFGYPQASSHYQFQQETLCHYGIDIRYGVYGQELPILPAAKRHILFGLIDEQRNLIFIKPENYGLYYLDGIPMHGLELTLSLLRKSSTIPIPYLSGFVQRWIGSDDDPTNRKERVPENFVKAMAAIITQAEKSGEITAEVAKHIKLRIKIDGLKILTDDELMNKLKPAIQSVIKRYDNKQEFDHLKLRTGREVIFKDSDLSDLRSKI